MTERQARKLVEGDSVMWDKDNNDTGEVIEVGYCGVKIKWDNGQVGSVHFSDMSKIDIVRGDFNDN